MIKAKLTDSVSISEIMTLREQGLSMKEIASRLDTSVTTIRKYIGPSRKRTYTAITPEIKQRMFDLREQGMSNKEIAATLHVSDQTVLNHIGKQPKAAKESTSKIDLQELKRLREQGMSQKALAEHFNMSQSTINYHLKRLFATPSASPQPTPPEPVSPPTAEPRVISKITDKTVQEILVMSKNGMSCRKIGERLGLSISHVAKILRAHSEDEPATPSAEPEVQLRPVQSFRERLNAVLAEQNQTVTHHTAPSRPEPEVEPELDPVQDEPIAAPLNSRPITPPYSHSWHEVETVYRLVGCSACYLANVTAQKVTITDRKEQLIGRFTKDELAQYISELERVLWVLEGQQEGKEKP